MQPSSPSPESNLYHFPIQPVAERARPIVVSPELSEMHRSLNLGTMGIIGSSLYRPDGNFIMAQEFPEKIGFSTIHPELGRLAMHSYHKTFVLRYGLAGDDYSQLESGAMTIARHYQGLRLEDITSNQVGLSPVPGRRLHIVR